MESKKCRFHYLQKVQTDLTSNPKSGVTFKSLKADNDIPCTMVLNDKSSTGEYEVSNLFKELFSSVYSSNCLNINKSLITLKNSSDIC